MFALPGKVRSKDLLEEIKTSLLRLDRNFQYLEYPQLPEEVDTLVNYYKSLHAEFDLIKHAVSQPNSQPVSSQEVIRRVQEISLTLNKLEEQLRPDRDQRLHEDQLSGSLRSLIQERDRLRSNQGSGQGAKNLGSTSQWRQKELEEKLKAATSTTEKLQIELNQLIQRQNDDKVRIEQNRNKYWESREETTKQRHRENIANLEEKHKQDIETEKRTLNSQWLNSQKIELERQRGALEEDKWIALNEQTVLHDKELEEHKKKMEASHASIIAQMVKKRESEAERIQAEHDEEVEQLKSTISEYKTKWEEVEHHHQQEINQLREKHEVEIIELRKDHSVELGRLEAAREIQKKKFKEELQQMEMKQEQREEEFVKEKSAIGRIFEEKTAEIRQANATLQNRLLERDGYKGLTDTELRDGKDVKGQAPVQGFVPFANRVETLAGVDWKNNRKAWPNGALLVLNKNEKRLKRRILGDLIWNLLFQHIFCSPFRVLGEEGKILENDWLIKREVGRLWPMFTSKKLLPDELQTAR
jgi:hypothetical protein